MYLRINNINIPISNDAAVRLDRYSSIFADDITTGEFSFPFDLPITRELKQALSNVDFEKANLTQLAVEYVVDIIDGGITRWRATMTLLGKSKTIGTVGSLRVNLQVGISKIVDWMKNTKLRAIDYGTVTLNDSGDVVKFVTFQLDDPGAFEAPDTGDLNIAVNAAPDGGTSVPFVSDIYTTIANFVISYNSTVAATNENTASTIGGLRIITFTANTPGPDTAFDYSTSIADATVPFNSGTGHPMILSISAHFDYAGYGATIAAAATTINGMITSNDPMTAKVFFPMFKNPKHIVEFLGIIPVDRIPGPGEEVRYLNYSPPGSTDLAYNDGSDDNNYWTQWLVPMPYVYYILTTALAVKVFKYADDISKEDAAEQLIIFNQRSLDQKYALTPDITINIFAPSFAIADHVPDITVYDLVTALKIWANCMLLIDDSAQTVKLLKIDDLFDQIANSSNRAVIEDFSAEEVTEEDWDFPDYVGATLQFTNDSNDDAYNELVKELSSFVVTGQLTTPIDLFATYAPSGTIYYITSLNQFWISSGELLGTGKTWSVFAEKVNDYVDGDGSTVVTTTLSVPLTVYEVDGFDPSGTPRSIVVPYVKESGYNGYDHDTKAVDNYSLRILYARGSVNDSAMGPYWLASNHYTTPFAASDFDHSLHWWGNNGVWYTWHRRFYNFLRFGRLCRKMFILPFAKQLMMNLQNWIFANGKFYLIKRLSMALPWIKAVKGEFVQDGGELPFRVLCLDADVVNFCVNNNISDPVIQTALCTLVGAWKQQGLWDNTFNLFPIVGGNQDAHKESIFINVDFPLANTLSWVAAPNITNTDKGIEIANSVDVSIGTKINFQQQPIQLGATRCYGVYLNNLCDDAQFEWLFEGEPFYIDGIHTPHSGTPEVAFAQLIFATTSGGFSGKGFLYAQTDGTNVEMYLDGVSIYSGLDTGGDLSKLDTATDFFMWFFADEINESSSIMNFAHTGMFFLTPDQAAAMYAAVLAFEEALGRN